MEKSAILDNQKETHEAPLLADHLLPHITPGLPHLSGSFLCRCLRGSTSIDALCNNLIVVGMGNHFLAV